MGLIVTLIIAIPVSLIWARGIDKMNSKHPDYKGEDFLNW